MKFDKATLAKIKMDSNKWKAALGIEVDLLQMIKDGLIEIVGEKDASELIYKITPAGVKYLKEAKGKL